MMRRTLGLFAGLVVLLCAPATKAQYYGTELPFVLGTGARASGLGGSGVSLSGDASVQYYNPSALSYQQWKQFTFFRTALFESDASYHAASYAHPLLNYGTIGVSLLRLDVGRIEERDDSNRLLSDNLSNSQTRLLLGYGHHVTSSVVAGFNLKVDHQSFGSLSGTGVGLDLGVSASQRTAAGSFLRGFRQGLAIQNLVEPSVKLEQESVADPMQIAFGFSMLSGVGGANLVTSIDFVNPRFSPFRVQVGQEINYQDRFSFRLGMDDSSPTYGLGATFKNVTFDYAFRNIEIGNNHRFSVAFKFGSSKVERITEARAKLERDVNNQINTRMVDLERSQIENAIQRGDRFFAAKSYDEALTQYESALLWDPENAHASEHAKRSKYHQSIMLAQTAFAAADYVQATFFANQALAFAPQDETATQLTEQCNAKIAASQRSSEMVGELLKTSIDFYSERKYSKALAGFNQVLQIDRSNSLASEYAQKSTTQIEKIVQTFVRNARVSENTSDYDAALDLLERAREIRPQDALIQQRIIGVSQKRKAARRVTSKPKPKPRVTRDVPRRINTPQLEKKYGDAMQHFEGGNFDAAVRLFADVWTVAPEFHDVATLLTKGYIYVGMNLYSRDQHAEALEVWKKALVVDPGNVKARRYLRRASEELQQLNPDN